MVAKWRMVTTEGVSRPDEIIIDMEEGQNDLEIQQANLEEATRKS